MSIRSLSTIGLSYDETDLASPNPDTDAEGNTGDFQNLFFRGAQGPGLLDKILTPYDPQFGAIGDGVTDDTVSLNRFFAHGRIAANARRYVYDWSQGEFLITNTVYICYPQSDANQPLIKLIGGRIKVAPLASLPEGLPLEVAVEIAGPRQQWRGRLEINRSGSVEYAGNYVDRRFITGIRMRTVNGSNFPDIYVDDSKRDVVWINSNSAGYTVDGLTYVTANCIGATIKSISGRVFGSTHQSAAAYGTKTTLISKDYGTYTGIAFSGETYISGGSWGNTLVQRTRLTVGSTANLNIYDLVKTRLELTPSIYDTIEYANGSSKIIWTAGDPTTYLEVGDTYPIIFNGVNASVIYTIISFGGTSNREITVTPSPTDQAPSSNIAHAQYGNWDFACVSNVIDATNFTVFPWIPSRNNSDIYIVHGSIVRIDGGDTANIVIGSVRSLIGGTGPWIHGLYGPQIGTVLSEICEVGIRLASPTAQVIGFNLLHGHLEGCTRHVTIEGNAYGQLNLQSAFDAGNISVQTARAATNSQNINAVEGSLSSVILYQQGKLTLASSNTTVASLRLPPGAAATTLYNGDTWTETTGFKVRINGYTLSLGRDSGWAAATGTATKTTFATGSVTLSELAERVKALTDFLLAHGILTA